MLWKDGEERDGWVVGSEMIDEKTNMKTLGKRQVPTRLSTQSLLLNLLHLLLLYFERDERLVMQ